MPGICEYAGLVSEVSEVGMRLLAEIVQDHRLGYGRRTLTMLRDWCFNELRLTSPFGESVRMSKVTAVCLPDDEIPQALLGDLLTPLGATVLKHTADGSPVDALSFALTREEYEASRQA